LNIIAPIRDLNLTRDKELKYASEMGIKISDIAKKYSIDENLWGRAIEGGVLENLENEPLSDSLKYVHNDNTSPEYITIGFEKGIPISINDQKMNLEKLITELNNIAGSHGIGIIDHIEDRIVGIKSREVYEAPAALVLIEAHKDLEKLVLTNSELRFKLLVDDQWAWLSYSGLWHDPLLSDLNAFIERTQQRVSGEIKIKMHNESYRVVGRKSMFSLYNNDTVTYLSNSNFDQTLARGFVALWGLQSTVANSKIMENKE
jgi:argininosuccinate synthase